MCLAYNIFSFILHITIATRVASLYMRSKYWLNRVVKAHVKKKDYINPMVSYYITGKEGPWSR